MPDQDYVLLNFNRGLISDLGLARQDIERVSLSAAIQKNMPPRVLGSMMLRPGLGYIDGIYDDKKPFHIPFIYDDEDTDETAAIEITDQAMRIRVSESILSRQSVSTVITNSSFDTDLTAWTDNDQAGCTSSWATGGYMSLVGTKFNQAIRYQLVSVAAQDQNVAHGIRISVHRGEAILNIGSTSGGGEYVYQRVLKRGVHSLEITPTGNFYIQLSSKTKYATLISSCEIESVGDVVLNAPWVEADLSDIRYDQSGDVVYVACRGYQQRKILRYDERSWSLVYYEPNSGPFRAINTTNTTLTPSALSGDITVTASQNLFSSTDVGALYRIESTGQKVEVSAGGADQWSDSIRVTGVSAARRFYINISGTWTATVTVQQSIGEEGNWTNYVTYTSNQTNALGDDGLNNQIIYYRIGINTGDYTSGTAVCSITYNSGSIDGIFRVTEYTSGTQVSAIVLRDLGQTVASDNWYEGAWSETRGFPQALALHDGRLVHGGNGKIDCSASDGFEDFDDLAEGDSRAFRLDIPKGSRNVKWMLSLKRLMFGTKTHEWFLRSSAYDEVVTPENANIKSPSNQGSAGVAGIEYDGAGLFIQRAGSRLFQSEFKAEADDYRPDDLSKIIPEFMAAGVVRIAMQRQPDTRVHCIMADGTAMVLVLDELEDVKGWFSVETDGLIEDAFILPEAEEDAVYYSVKRIISGATKRYLEKWAMESECQGGTLNKQADSFIVYQGAAISTITGLIHLEGEEVVCWADGADYSSDDSEGVQQTYTVTSGQITLSDPVENAIVGLPYNGRYQSTKLNLQAQKGTSLLDTKKINQIGFVLKNTLKSALKYGESFDEMYDLPDVEGGETLADSYLHETYDEELFDFGGDYGTDVRICLEVKAPRPCTILACVATVVVNE